MIGRYDCIFKAINFKCFLSEDGSKEQSLLNEVGGETEEISAIQDCSVEATPIELSDVSFISNEDIPVLDKNLKTNISLNLRPDNTRAVSKNGGSPARKKAKNQFSNPSTKISNFKPSVKIRMDPITYHLMKRMKIFR